MLDKKTLLAFLLIALILMLTPYYYRFLGLPIKEDNSINKNAVDTTLINYPYPKEPQIHKKTPNNLNVTKEFEEKIINISTPLYYAKISSKGGGSFLSFQLKKYKTHSGDYVNLIREGQNENNLIISFKSPDGDTVRLDNNFHLDLNYKISDTLTIDTKPFQIDYQTEVLGFKITKSLIFHPDSYMIDVLFDLSNLSRNFISQEKLFLGWYGGLPNTEKNIKDDITYFAGHLYQGGELSKLRSSSHKSIQGSGITTWTSVRSKYFIAAMIPRTESNYGSVTVRFTNKIVKNHKQIPIFDMILGFPSNKPVSSSLYFGPLKYRYLKNLNVGLDKTMNFGWSIIQPISHGVLFLLTFMYKIIPNYGVLLIIFSIVIKIIVYPLTKKSYQSTKEMQAIQPLILNLREKYKGNPQRLNQETIKLYKEHGVNPLGGCLPMLLQMPLLFALFIVFRTTIELRGAPFVWWIQDLSAPDTIFELPFSIPLYGDQVSLLPIFMGASMFIQQKMMGSQTSGQQKFMSYFMTGFFLLLFNNFPSGLNLYYTLFNILTILQQKYLVNPKKVPEKGIPNYKKAF